MLVSLNWLATHLDLAGLDTPRISELLTFAGVEVENITERGVTSDQVVVAQVLEAVQHPNADRLKVCQVDAGHGRTCQIVCGATNYKVGDKVPLAMPGAVLPGGFAIQEGKLRGVESAGMMCSGRELGLSDDHGGLLILPEDAPVGAPLRAVVSADTLIEVEVTPNRPDLLSHFGLARELSALTGRALQGLDAPQVPEQEAQASLVTLEAGATCPYYTARLIRGVKVAPSPEWLQQRLVSIGLRPINNIVDVTNFVLHETGQPLHAFDAATLRGGRVIVRQAQAGEVFLALDGSEHSLETSDCVIADAERVVALAGVMGGADSGVGENTVDVLLESAWFAPATIRRTARVRGLASDSSYRFERGADPEMVRVASSLATTLILEVAGGQAEDILHVAGAPPARTGLVALDAAAAQAFLGGHVAADAQASILQKLGLIAAGHDLWQVPSFRADLQRPIDLIEEIARVHGLANVPSRLLASPAARSAQDIRHDFVIAQKSLLAGLGMFESRTLKLISRAQLADVPISAQPVPLKNPLSEDHTVLRPALLPGLLAVARHNRAQGASRLAFFEVGTVFRTGADAAVEESQSLAMLLGGEFEEVSWATPQPRLAEFADLRALLDRLLPSGQKIKVQAVERTGCILAAELSVSKKEILGVIGQIHPARARAMDCAFPVYFAELDLARLQALREATPARFVELPKFPASTRDVAVELPIDLPASRIESALGNLAEPLLVGWRVFDLFHDPSGQRLPAERKSLAWTMTYRDRSRTLRAEEVDAAHAKVRESLAKLQGVNLR